MEKGGVDDAQSTESLNDVARDRVLREVEKKREGDVTTERSIECLKARCSTPHCYPRECTHHD